MVNDSHVVFVHGFLAGTLLPGERVVVVSHPDSRVFLHSLIPGPGPFSAELSVGCNKNVYPGPESFTILLVPPDLAGLVTISPPCERAPLSADAWARLDSGATVIGSFQVRRVLRSTTPPTTPPTTTPTTPPPTPAAPVTPSTPPAAPPSSVTPTSGVPASRVPASTSPPGGATPSAPSPPGPVAGPSGGTGS